VPEAHMENKSFKKGASYSSKMNRPFFFRVNEVICMENPLPIYPFLVYLENIIKR
jgi:hypothetical protein